MNPKFSLSSLTIWKLGGGTIDLIRLTYLQKIIQSGKTSLLLLVYCFYPLLAQAQTSDIPIPSEAPLELNLIQQEKAPTRPDVITANTISQDGLTAPSLWWAREQFAGKMLNNWIAYPTEKRVDLVVNRQLWTLLDYMDRYRFVNEFGNVARDFGYNIRVFNPQKMLLAAYTCNFNSNLPNCQIWLESSSQDSLRLRLKPEASPF
ncbi:MAG: hypothetical protein WBB28_15305 [Crinalium sp.]